MRFAADGERGIGGNGWGAPSSDGLVSDNPGEVNGGMLIRRLGVVGSAIVLGVSTSAVWGQRNGVVFAWSVL